MKRHWFFPLAAVAVVSICCAGYSDPATANGSRNPLAGDGYSPSPGYGSTVRCESNDSRVERCYADTRGGVRLNRQLSNSPCIQGRSWGYDAGGVWVSQGCRAEFVTGTGGGYGPGHGNGQVVRCESNDNRYRRCNADTRGGVRLSRRLSDAQCIQGRSWGFDGGGIWVSQGCRAEFVTNIGWGHGNKQTVRCESNDNRVRRCNVDTRGGVRISRQLSGSPCTRGRSWGYDRSGIWVSQGCRAEFVTGGYGAGYGPGQTLRCESVDGRSHRCNMPVRGGVQLARQLSGTRCIERQNWGWDRNGVWVTSGCRAEFLVY